LQTSSDVSHIATRVFGDLGATLKAAYELDVPRDVDYL
jgi:hypothetical protein